MLALERMKQILEMLNNHESVMVGELSQKFNVSEETIRRDLDKIERENTGVVRVHGGACKIDSIDKEVPVQIREGLLVKEKQKIADHCLTLVKGGDSIMLDSSTTALFLAKRVKEAGLRLTIITNSLEISQVFDNQEHVKLICTGGTLRPSAKSFVGYSATNSLRAFHANKAFVSCSGVHADFGMTDNDEDEAHVRNLMLQNSDNRYLIADYTKFGKCKVNRIAGFEMIDLLITDSNLSAQWKTLLKTKGIHHTCC